MDNTNNMPPIRSAAVLLHPKIARSQEIADTVCAALDNCSLHISRGSVWDIEQLHEVLPRVDVAITLGGDGSILRVTRVAALYETPLLGINLGHLGFLAEIEPDDVAARIPPLVRGGYWIERRIMLQVEHHRGRDILGTYQAVNEAVVGRRSLSRVVRVPVRLDGQELTTYRADGVLVATPTGSTAYSHAAGGPILHPEVRSFVLTPICAYPNASGSIVVPAETGIALTAHTDHEAALSIDGQDDVLLRDGDEVALSLSPHTARFLRGQSRNYFYATLPRKLRL